MYLIESMAEQTGRTPLHDAADKGYEAIAELLLKRDALINFADEVGLHVWSSVLILSLFLTKRKWFRYSYTHSAWHNE